MQPRCTMDLLPASKKLHATEVIERPPKRRSIAKITRQNPDCIPVRIRDNIVDMLDLAVCERMDNFPLARILAASPDARRQVVRVSPILAERNNIVESGDTHDVRQIEGLAPRGQRELARNHAGRQTHRQDFVLPEAKKISPKADYRRVNRDAEYPLGQATILKQLSSSWDRQNRTLRDCLEVVV